MVRIHIIKYCTFDYIFLCLFSDLLGMNAGGQGQALGFQVYGNNPEKPVVSLLASRNARKSLKPKVVKYKCRVACADPIVIQQIRGVGGGGGGCQDQRI